jgi:plasmid maintenance system antidote protein VapI
VEEIKRIAVQRQPGQIVSKPLSQKNLTQKGLVEWLKVKAEFKPQY